MLVLLVAQSGGLLRQTSKKAAGKRTFSVEKKKVPHKRVTLKHNTRAEGAWRYGHGGRISFIAITIF